ncbi:iron-containing alcohol dehydrogenase [Chelativorans sp. AA-79]|uniref:iron-containing alcohol dehydrogenase n=1 Tax=Chelativorans sp. AA-79 TaxID=3028735 RepID=UPI0023F9BF9D|nr:iron-containing alcohol dehydrogenase [Chelativorans sp. AA-79]WEX10773.1 iron-containing alcohol dehydrogenase [Chelativorans sp. AA-79]
MPNIPSSFDLPGDVYNATPPRIIFGAGKAGETAREVERLGAIRALVVCTPGRRAMADKVVELLGARCVGILPEAVSQVPIELARRWQEHARKGGGGRRLFDPPPL